MVYLLLYTLSALCAMIFVFWQTAENEHAFSHTKDEDKSKTVMIILAVLWPLTLLMIFFMSLWERYTRSIRKKVKKLYNDYQTPDDLKINEEDDEIADYTIKNKAINRMPTKELEYLLFASKIQAIELHEASKNLVQRLLEDRAFEKEILGIKYGKESSSSSKERSKRRSISKRKT